MMIIAAQDNKSDNIESCYKVFPWTDTHLIQPALVAFKI